MDNIVKMMGDLQISEDPVKLLSEMKITVMAVPSQDFSSASRNNIEALQPLFDFLNSDNKDQVAACVQVLYQILKKLKPKIVLSTFRDQILKGFKHPNEDVRILVIKELSLCCLDNKCIEDLVSSEILDKICQSLADSSLDAVKYAKKSMIAIHNHEEIKAAQILTPERLQILKNVMNSSDSCRFQVYEVIVQICIMKQSSMVHISSIGLLQSLVNEMTGGDVLTQLNALEMLSDLVLSQHGFCYLQKAGIIEKLGYLLSSAKMDPMAAIILPGVLKFFGHVGASHANLLAESQTSGLVEIMKIASDFNNDGELSIQLIAFETLAHIGSTVEGKTALQKFNVEMESCIWDLSKHLPSFGMDLKIRFLEAVSVLFSFQSTTGCSEDLLNGMGNWFNSLSTTGSSLRFLLELAQRPFPELLFSTLKVMTAVAHLPWGIQLISQEPGMIEWMLNRNIGLDKPTKEKKFELIAAIEDNPWAKEHLSQEVLDKITQFRNQGPFFVDSEYVVAVDKR